MIKKGFTLAEILIVMGIVGVIAALTLPMLMTSVSNKSNAAKLSAAISDVENAFTYMLTSEKVGDILDSDFWRGEFDSDSIKSIGKYLKISVADKDFRDYDYYTLKDSGSFFTDISGNNFDPGNNFILTAKGVMLFFDMKTLDKENDEEKETISQLVIDVNSDEKPNIVGRDVFIFALSKKGKLYPYGSKRLSKIADINYWDEEGDYSCTDDSKKLGCTARLMEKGFEMDY